jgi:hypothetical protein
MSGDAVRIIGIKSGSHCSTAGFGGAIFFMLNVTMRLTIVR